MPKPLNLLNKILLILIAIFATIGMFDSLYLTVTHYTKANVPCSVTHGCETVLRSSYSEILGIPVAAFGVVFYVVMLFGVIYMLTNKTYHWWLSAWGLVGVCSTLYLLYIQGVVLHAWCQYCLLSAFTSTLIFVLTTMLYFKNNFKQQREKQNDKKIS